ncbi:MULTISPECIES: hypothetical protein [unclassified Streptomyces]|uniref:hypothetical protein n=1 Tax=unclassified Streptomyces TaxID=2593676 RepID=UPI000DBA1575|nr:MULTISPECIES: hypothetical protein [unclassified Streptomyces]MYT72612.1 hypothetical protein [Streptomyces sp. SID8367]RAJ79469.1 hypothetical protein K377_05189 [Streptomyces sp. PsTaAH-137]
MHGHGYAPPPRLPSSGAQAGLRVLFVALAVLSCGFLAFVPVLRLAVTTRRKADWGVFAGVAALQFICWVGVFSDPGADEFTTWWGNTAMGLMFVDMIISVSYYLVCDIRFVRRHPQPMGAAPYGVQPPPVYGYPQPQHQPQPQQYPQAPVAPPVHGMTTQTGGTAPLPHQTPAPAPAPAPQPSTQGQPPQRIDQVRAELDELSDYLRKQDGGR